MTQKSFHSICSLSFISTPDQLLEMSDWEKDPEIFRFPQRKQQEVKCLTFIVEGQETLLIHTIPMSNSHYGMLLAAKQLPHTHTYAHIHTCIQHTHTDIGTDTDTNLFEVFNFAYLSLFISAIKGITEMLQTEGRSVPETIQTFDILLLPATQLISFLDEHTPILN